VQWVQYNGPVLNEARCNAKNGLGVVVTYEGDAEHSSPFLSFFLSLFHVSVRWAARNEMR